MNSEIIGLLKSTHVEDRKEAIKLLARTESDDALRYLARIYQTDADYDVRELALKAGQYIKKRQHSGGWEADNAGDAYYEDAYEDDESFVNHEDMERASKLIERAVDALMVDDKREAAILCKEALSLNPDLVHDPYFANIVGDIMNMENEAALNALQRMSIPEADTPKSKRKNKGAPASQEGGCLGATLSLGIVGAITSVLGIAAIFFLIQGVVNVFDAVEPQMAEQAGISAAEYEMLWAELETEINAVTVPASIIGGLMVGLFATIYNVIWLFLVHIAAANILSGVGTFPGLVQKLTLPLIANTVVGLGAFTVQLYTVTTAMDASAFNAFILDDPYAMEQFYANLSTSYDVLYNLSCIASVGVLIWFVVAIGKHYDFGLGNGCLSLIISSILLCVVGCGCGMLLLVIPV